jgi:DNA invertase Pin-like site-specific DNA recombinase
MSNKRAALYVRVSTDAQTVENQIRELRQVAGRRGWDVIEVYSDGGISGAKGRNGRPGLDSMLKDASRRKFDIVMAWAIDRLGRSLCDLLDTIQHLEARGVDLYLDQQAIDKTTPTGNLVLQVTGAFAEFERTMIRQRVKAGLKHAVAQGVKLRPAEDRQRDRTEGAKAACEGCGYFKGGQVARDRNWYRSAQRKGASNEPARGGAMSKGERTRVPGRSPKSLLRRAGPPVLFFWRFQSCPFSHRWFCGLKHRGKSRICDLGLAQGRWKIV